MGSPGRPPLALRQTSAITGLARAFSVERRRILAAVPEAQVIHTGASSLPTMLTRGDLDIHVRVPPEAFRAALAALREHYADYRPEMWTDDFAALVGDGGSLPVGVVLTAAGGEHDARFVTAWARLAAEPALVDELNALKTSHAQAGPDSYEEAKSAFFDRLEASQRRK